MKKIVFGLMLSLFISGCASMGNQPMDANNRAAMKGKSIAYTVHKSPDFMPWTPKKAIKDKFARGEGGIVGAIISYSITADTGEKVVSANHIDDPAKFIAAGLGGNLKAGHAGRLIMAPILVESDNVDQIVAAAKGAQYIVNVQTMHWGFEYFPLHFKHYRVRYEASAQVLDAQTKAVIAQGSCLYLRKDKEEGISYEVLLAEEAMRLKNELAIAARQCVAEMTQQILAP